MKLNVLLALLLLGPFLSSEAASQSINGNWEVQGNDRVTVSITTSATAAPKVK